MSLTWSRPAALWLLVALPLVWAVLRVSRTNFNPRQRLVQAGVRTALLAALILALALPAATLGSSSVCVVYLVDASDSVAPSAVLAAADAIDALTTQARPSVTRLMAFGANAVVVDNTDALRALVRPERTTPSVLDRGGTDLERALETARAELEPGHVPRIVLFSDGRQTAGDVRRALASLDGAPGLQTRGDVPVSVVPLEPVDRADTWIDSVDLPDAVPASALVTVPIGVRSQRAAQAVVELKVDGEVRATRALALSPGLTSVPLDLSIDRPGAAAVEASVHVGGDPAPRERRAGSHHVGPAAAAGPVRGRCRRERPLLARRAAIVRVRRLGGVARGHSLGPRRTAAVTTPSS